MSRSDIQAVALAAARDVVDEMRRDVDGGRGWDDALRRDLVERLTAILTP